MDIVTARLTDGIVCGLVRCFTFQGRFTLGCASSLRRDGYSCPFATHGISPRVVAPKQLLAAKLDQGFLLLVDVETVCGCF
jgi:hypothetical protein